MFTLTSLWMIASRNPHKPFVLHFNTQIIIIISYLRLINIIYLIMKEGFYAKKEFWNDRFQK
jgi:hypothetical protein